MDRARSLRVGQTDAEQLLWHHWRNRRLQGWKFRRQNEIGLYVVDFVCPDAGLVVELDGGQHGDQLIYDEARARKLGNRAPACCVSGTMMYWRTLKACLR